jgi:hypothetical protein
MGLLLTLILSYCIILQLHGLTTHLKQIKERSKIYLCTKKLALMEENLINKMEILNLVIKNSTFVDVAKILFPPLTGIPTQEVKKTAQGLQLIEHISFLKKGVQLQFQKCSLHPQFARTPYQVEGFQLVRNQFGETILKNQQWRNYVKGEHLTLILESKVEKKWRKIYHGKVLKLETPLDQLF